MSPSRGVARVLLLLLTAIGACALQANLAGVVDWHKPLIGVPLLEPSPPSFVDTYAGRRLVAITRSNVLASLNAENGDVVWRHQFEQEDPVVSYHVKDDYLLLVSGPSGTTARLFNLTTGHALWERPLLTPNSAHITNPVHLGTDASFSTEELPSVVILSGGKRVTKIRLATGTEDWASEAPGVGDNVLFKQVFISENSVHILALTNSFASQTLTTLTLDLQTSIPLDDFTQIPCIVEAPGDAHLMGSDIPGSVRVVWWELGKIRVAYVGAGGYLGNTRDLVPGGHKIHYEKILPLNTKDTGLILGMKRGGEVHVLDVREGGKRVAIWEQTTDSSDKSPSTYSSAKTSDGVVFSRIYWSYAQSWAVIEAMSVSFSGDKVHTGYTFAFDTAAHGVVLASAVTPMPAFPDVKDRSELMPRLFLSTSSGALQLVHGQGVGWTRDESLAEVAAARFVDLGEPAVETTRALLAEESFMARSARHLSELQALPAYLLRFAQRLVSSSYTSAQKATALRPGQLHRDQFGLQKLLVLATKDGKIFALDSASGHPVWIRNLGLTGVNGTELNVKGMWNVRDVGVGDGPMLAVLATRTNGEETSTVGFDIDALTGVVQGDANPQTGLPQGKEIFAGQSETAFLVPFENCGTLIRVLAVVDASHKLHIYPACKKVAADLWAINQNISFTTSERSLSGYTLSGHAPSSINSTQLGTSTTWTRGLTPGEIHTASSPVEFENVASFGRPLGDKSVLYKYLNPHLMVVTSVNPSKGYAKVEVIDSLTGTVVYTTTVTGSTVRAGMVENWLIFGWQDGDGWRLGSVELYEDVNGERGRSPGSSSFAGHHDVIVQEQTYFLGSGIKALGFSASHFGITQKELIYINDRNQVATIPRRLLDPRRPKGKPTSAEKEEMLVPYDALLPHEPKRIISHQYEVLGAEHIVTSPALVESTSLLFTYGLDLFLTRGITPSGSFDILSDSFNKLQILLSLAGLSVGIVMAKPAVTRKMLKMRWY